MKIVFAYIFLFFSTLSSYSQQSQFALPDQFVLTKQVVWEDIDKGIIDNQGHLFITNQKGDLAKFSPDGELLLEFSPMLNIQVSQINANTQLKVLLFYEDLQSFTLLNRYLTSPVVYPLSKFGLGYISTLTITPQQDIWAMDVTDFSLKKLDIQRDEVLETKSLSTLLDREEASGAKLLAHQNRIYLSVRNHGLYVFDNIGNYLFHESDLSFELNFFRDELYYENAHQLILKNLNSNEERFLPLPDENRKQLLYYQDQLYILHSDGFSIYKYLRHLKAD